MGRLLEIAGLSAYYGSAQVLHDVGLFVEDGGITALLGANGAGKTTLLRAISRLVRTTGTLSFAGQPLAPLATEQVARLGIAHVPDGRGTFVRMTVEENLRLATVALRRRVAAEDAIAQVYGHFPRLAERRRQQAGTLSGGEQQMLAIGRALVGDPRLIILDEPSFGLAPAIVLEIFAIMRTINRDRGVAILLVEQNAALALALARQAFVLETGYLVMQGPASAIANDDSIRKSYLGC